MILTTAQMRAVEDASFAGGATAESLMEEAGRGLADAIGQFFPRPSKAVVYVGKGNNGGDALVVARQLVAAGWQVGLRLCFAEHEISELALRQLVAARAHCEVLDEAPVGGEAPAVAIDGLLGIGAAGALRSPLLEAAAEINWLREERAVRVIALDLPTGLDADTGQPSEGTVIADYTFTVGFVKRGLVADQAANVVGRLGIVPLEQFGMVENGSTSAAGGEEVVTSRLLSGCAPLREFDSHKGHYGRVGVFAGSPGFTGAAILCAEAAVRAGAGLVTLFARDDIYHVLAANIAPEVMVFPVGDYSDVALDDFDVLAIGPGLGTARSAQVLPIIKSFRGPAVIDADGLNMLAQQPATLRACAGPRLLTPHPGEMLRLQPQPALSRAANALDFARDYPVTLMLKGARSVIATEGRPLAYNSTGGPGMASGGMGDVVCGVCAALCAQNVAPHEAACAGAWLVGRAAEIALGEGGQSEESLRASDAIEMLGGAFHDLRRGCY